MVNEYKGWLGIMTSRTFVKKVDPDFKEMLRLKNKNRFIDFEGTGGLLSAIKYFVKGLFGAELDSLYFFPNPTLEKGIGFKYGTHYKTFPPSHGSYDRHVFMAIGMEELSIDDINICDLRQYELLRKFTRIAKKNKIRISADHDVSIYNTIINSEEFKEAYNKICSNELENTERYKIVGDIISIYGYAYLEDKIEVFGLNDDKGIQKEGYYTKPLNKYFYDADHDPEDSEDLFIGLVSATREIYSTHFFENNKIPKEGLTIITFTKNKKIFPITKNKRIFQMIEYKKRIKNSNEKFECLGVLLEYEKNGKYKELREIIPRLQGYLEQSIESFKEKMTFSD